LRIAKTNEGVRVSVFQREPNLGFFIE